MLSVSKILCSFSFHNQAFTPIQANQKSVIRGHYVSSNDSLRNDLIVCA